MFLRYPLLLLLLLEDIVSKGSCFWAGGRGGTPSAQRGVALFSALRSRPEPEPELIRHLGFAITAPPRRVPLGDDRRARRQTDVRQHGRDAAELANRRVRCRRAEDARREEGAAALARAGGGLVRRGQHAAVRLLLQHDVRQHAELLHEARRRAAHPGRALPPGHLPHLRHRLFCVQGHRQQEGTPRLLHHRRAARGGALPPGRPPPPALPRRALAHVEPRRRLRDGQRRLNRASRAASGFSPPANGGFSRVCRRRATRSPA